MILSKIRRPKYNLLINSKNVIKESGGVKIVGLIIYKKLSFKKYIAKLYLIASYNKHHEH